MKIGPGLSYLQYTPEYFDTPEKKEIETK